MRDLCSSANKVNSLGKQTNRWLNIYTNKMLLGDGNDDSNVLLVADIGNITNPAIRYNVINGVWEFSNNGTEYNAFGTGEDIPETPTSTNSKNMIFNQQLCTGSVGQVVYFTYVKIPPRVCHNNVSGFINVYNLENKTFSLDYQENIYTYDEKTEFILDVNTTPEIFFTDYQNSVTVLFDDDLVACVVMSSAF